MELTYFLNLYKSYRSDLNFSRNSNIKIFNFWPLQKPEDLWLYLFINERGLIPKGKTLSVYSVFGDRFKMKFDLFRPKIFFTGENSLYRPNYKDHCLKDVNLSLGHDYIIAENYLRFPLWYFYFIKPWFTLQDVKKWVDEVSENNKLENVKGRKFCSLVSGHDPLGYRTQLFNLLSGISRVESGGHLLKNTNDLQALYQNDKNLFIKNYRYNISIENSDSNGYVTEKIFHSIIAGCLPVYWGSEFNPEPEILNSNRILFFDPSNEGKLFQQIETFEKNEKLFNEFYMQDVFMKNAAEMIYEKFLILEKKIKDII